MVFHVVDPDPHGWTDHPRNPANIAAKEAEDAAWLSECKAITRRLLALVPSELPAATGIECGLSRSKKYWHTSATVPALADAGDEGRLTARVYANGPGEEFTVRVEAERHRRNARNWTLVASATGVLTSAREADIRADVARVLRLALDALAEKARD